MSRMVAWNVAIRTCIIDDTIHAAIRGGVDTVLNLGAGLDTRPYRMELPPSLHWVEADHPEIIDYKEPRLAGETARCRLRRVRVDLANLRERRELLASVNAHAKTILILTEGVVPYLSIDEAAALADDLRSLERARYWLVDYFHVDVMKFRNRRGMGKAMRNAAFRFAPADWFGFFREHGWKPREIRYLPVESERLGRAVPLPRLLKIAMKIGGLFVSEKSRKPFREFMGYVLLEPSTRVSATERRDQSAAPGG